MKSFLLFIERTLSPFFAELPPLPKKFKDLLAELMPILALVLGIVQLIAAWGLWQAGHSVNELVHYANELSQAYGGQDAVPPLGLFYWFDLVLLIADGIILLFAASGLQAKRKEGWELLLLSTVVYFAYGVVAMLDTSHGGIFKFLMVIFGTAVSLYFLFQLREYYTDKRARPEKHLPHPGKHHHDSDTGKPKQ